MSKLTFPQPRYRIVRDRYCGYEVQQKLWWCPWWHQPECNTRSTVEGAEQWLRLYLRARSNGNVVKYIEPDEIAEARAKGAT